MLSLLMDDFVRFNVRTLCLFRVLSVSFDGWIFGGLYFKNNVLHQQLQHIDSALLTFRTDGCIIPRKTSPSRSSKLTYFSSRKEAFCNKYIYIYAHVSKYKDIGFDSSAVVPLRQLGRRLGHSLAGMSLAECTHVAQRFLEWAGEWMTAECLLHQLSTGLKCSVGGWVNPE